MKASVIPAMFVLIGAMCGCDQLQQSPESTTPKAAVAAPIKPSVRVDQFDVFDLWMRKSLTTPVTGDMRPFWLVHGRIRNNSAFIIKSMRLSVRIWTKEEFTDSAVFEIKTEILPNGVQSFEQEIHLSPPSTKWDWDCNVISAESQ